MKKVIIIVFIFLTITSGIMVIGQTEKEPVVCCEKTISGLFCQDVPENECADGVRALPTSCESTSYCKPGVCYDSTEGTCTENTPQLVCNSNDGTWSEESPAQCELGCCTLGDQAAFVTLVRCKRLSAFLGLNTNYNRGITNEAQCVLSVSSQEKGACVYDFEFERTCRFTSRADCEGVDNEANGTIGGEFFVGKLCSAEELGTNCGSTEKTACIAGKDEVYFVDSCGNPTNIYDASKLKDDDYWANIVTKLDSCGKDTLNGNAGSAVCGNCNYLLGSYCRNSENAGVNARYGENICADLNCENTQNGKSYRHGESWCVQNDFGEIENGKNSVGSRFYKHICINGEEVLEQCADFRQEECVEDKIETNLGDFSQAACRVNRWQDCVAQKKKDDCENTDRRDCLWREGTRLYIEGASKEGTCLPKNPPGLRFWESEEALGVCSQADAKCVVTCEKTITEGEDCKGECWKDDGIDKKWLDQRTNICTNLGDCGPNVNWRGIEGYKKGYELKVERYRSGGDGSDGRGV